MSESDYPLLMRLPVHLPADVPAQLEACMQVLHDSPLPIGMVWLYGSYARGDFIRRRQPSFDGAITVYRSDIDLLVVLDDATFNGIDKKKGKIDQQLQEHEDIIDRIHVIYVTHVRLNRELANESYFYSDLVKEGVLLYDKGTVTLVEPEPLPLCKIQKFARSNFEKHFERVLGFQKSFEYSFLEKDHVLATFYLHQMAEHLFHCHIMVFTNYRHRSHDLLFLEMQAASQSPEIIRAFPKTTPSEKQRFERLCDAYINARYHPHFAIQITEVVKLARSIGWLQQMVFDTCTEKIPTFAPERKVSAYVPSYEFLDIDALKKSPPPKETIARQREALENTAKELELERRERELREQELESKDQVLESKEQELASKDQVLESKEQELASKEQELKNERKEKELREQELKNERKEKELREQELERLKKLLKEKGIESNK